MNVASNGFTVIEFLIVIVIFIMLIAASVPIYGNWQSTILLQSAKADIKQALLLAQARARAGQGNNAYGVFLNIQAGESDSIVSYQGESYAARNTDYDQVVNFSNNISLSSNLSGNDIVFSNGLGAASASGTLEVAFLNTGQTELITINSQGIID